MEDNEQPGSQPPMEAGMAAPTEPGLTAYVASGPALPRRGRLFLAVGVGTAAALAAGAFAVSSFSSADGGSSSPEAAVEMLLEAASNEDLIGVLEALPEGERSVLLDGVEGISSELQRLKVLSSELNLGAVKGLDLEFDDVVLESERLGEGVAAVKILSASTTSSFEPTAFPLGVLGELWWGDSVTARTTTDDIAADDDVVLVAIEEDGGWYVSAFYSMAEAARLEAGLAIPDFGDGVEAAGAASPEAAVSEAAKALATLDVRRLISLLAPDEMRALYDYAPLFLDDFETDVANLKEEESISVRIDELGTSAEVAGDLARVQIDAFKLTVVAAALERITFEWDGVCAAVSFAQDAPVTTCADDVEGLGKVLADRSYSVTVVEREGKWYLSPLRTAFATSISLLAGLDAGDFQDPEQLMEDFFGSVFGTAMAEPSLE